ncbi:MAG TPA: DinB family protein [Cytophagales bacterium]|nr:DinB family protein [Cytophagales bacterium]
MKSEQIVIKAEQTMVKMVLDRWYAQVRNMDNFLSTVTDVQLQSEIAPNKNRGVYILGHLIAVNDAMLPVLDFGDKLFPELYKPFLELPDKAVNEIPSAQELRPLWNKLNTVLSSKFDSLQADEWFQRHTSVSAEDFEKEPHRNKLNIIVTRTTHLAYHTGQVILLKDRAV